MSVAPLRVPVTSLRAGELRLDVATSRYVQRVHRLGRGDAVTVFDPEGLVEARAVIVEDGGHGCRVCVETPVPIVAPPRLRLCLVQAAGKGDKLDSVARDATALGVTTLVLLDAGRSVRRLGEVAGAKLERWRRICVQTARQCGRGDVPHIEIARSFEAALDLVASAEACWILDPRGTRHLGDLLASLVPNGTIAVFVGPEGGWTPGELEVGRRVGLETIRAWPHVLRTETAATALLGALAAVLDAKVLAPMTRALGDENGR